LNGTNQFLFYAADVTCRNIENDKDLLHELDLDDVSQSVFQEPLAVRKRNLKVTYFHFPGSIIVINILISF
jgi:hypothetical protein